MVNGENDGKEYMDLRPTPGKIYMLAVQKSC